MSAELHVRGVGKAYCQWSSELLRVASWLKLPVRPSEVRWVLRDVSFSVRPGETLGIIGQNGAGKSTLLKMVTGTTMPTEGSVSVNGRVAAILELGMGFNPELSARENVRHAAGLMGHTRQQIDRAMDEIEAFAEIGEYFDQPLRTYSSGMQMRVAFSVATAFRPDLLIVDEALSVGDSYFQHKSFDRIRRFREEGSSILFVSHGMADVKSLCDRVILLDAGRVLKEGRPDEVVDFYNALIAARENASQRIEQSRREDDWLVTRSGTGEATIERLELRDATSGEPVATAEVGQRLELRLVARVHADIPRLVLGYMVRDKQGRVVWGTNTWHRDRVQSGLRAGETVVFRLPFTCTLGPGSYSVSPALVSSDTHLVDNYEWVDNYLVFDVVNLRQSHFIGCNWLDGEFQVERR